MKTFIEAKTWLVLAFISLAFSACNNEDKRPSAPDYNPYIGAFTSGMISKSSPIQVRLAADYSDSASRADILKEDIFSIKPKSKGSLMWTDDRTIRFIPDEDWKSGKTYQVTVDLDKMLETGREYKKFSFSFTVIEQRINVDVDAFAPYNSNDLKWNKITGTLVTSDLAGDDNIAEIISAKQDNNPLPVTWIHNAGSRTHTFTIDSVARGDNESNVIISYDGDPVDSDSEGEVTYRVPALGEFILMNHRVVQHPDQYMVLQFSDPLKQQQDLEGLIVVENLDDVTFAIDGNQVRIYPAVRQMGSFTVNIDPGIKNSMGYRFNEQTKLVIAFESIKPAVRFPGKGVIIPSSGKLHLPFQAVNLKAVDVKVIKIFEDNVAQFLQVNHLDGSNQLARAGRLIKMKKIDLISGEPLDYGSWHTFGLNLQEIITPERGAIYRVEIDFRPAYSLYPCQGESGESFAETAADMDEEFETELKKYDGGRNYYYNNYNYAEYNWEDRDNPCTPSYYMHGTTKSRNVLASDLGLIAKQVIQGKLEVFVSDLITTDPLSGVEIRALNYQQQVTGTGTTDKNGKASVQTNGTAFLIVANYKEQKGYLRVDDASSLSLSNFDVSGQVTQQGMKGFVYCERGVWRPGDSIFVNFILEDPADQLPDNYPVILNLYNPLGQFVYKSVINQPVNNFYAFHLHTSSDAPTGNWRAEIKAGGAVFNKTLKVETIKPNRLKINFDLPGEVLGLANQSDFADLSVSWLHGANAGALRTTVNLTLSPVNTSFKGYEKYEFDDPSRRYEGTDDKIIFDKRANEKGYARVPLILPEAQRAPGMLKAKFVIRAFEEAGDFSIRTASKPYSPYREYVGLQLPEKNTHRHALITDTAHAIQVVTLDAEGNPVSRSGLKATVYKLDWRWWWQATDDNLAGWISRSHNRPVKEATINTSAGRGTFNFRVNYPQWGRYFIRIYDPASGHSTGKIVYVDWPSWVTRDSREVPGGATMLSFSADKEKYQPGDMANFSFPSSKDGRALVSIEGGDRIHDIFWLNTEQDETSFQIKISEEMAPNVYAFITLVQPHAQTANDLPIRMYGVTRVNVEDPGTRLIPVMKMPEVLKPEEEFKLTVSEKNDREMTYTVALVDEGILDLTNFKTPQPWDAFYAKEALGVKTWDIYNMVLGAYGGKIQSLYNIGGDDEITEAPDADRAKRFKPMVKFLGPFILKKGKTNTHVISVPNYVGSVRTMVVAGNGHAYGAEDETTPVRKPLMALATLPRVAGPGETIRMPVTVFAMEDNIKNVQVSLETGDLIESTGPNMQKISFAEKGEQLVFFDLKVKDNTGIARVRVDVKGGGEKAYDETELQVRNPNPRITRTFNMMLDAGEEKSISYQIPGMDGTRQGLVEFSSIPSVDFGRRLKYLLRYPHGCIEQTVSSAFPQLFLQDVMETDADFEIIVEQNVTAALNRIQLFALGDGSLSYWPGNTATSDWGTTYAGHFILEAEDKAYTLPVGLKNKWLSYQRKAARNWKPSGSSEYYAYRQPYLEQAYRLYTLAKAGSPEMGAMNRMREMKNISLQARWRLAAAYALAGQEDVASAMVNNASTEVPQYSGFYSSYGSALRDKAMILETMVLLNQRERGMELVQYIAERLSSTQWLSTQTTAYGLLGIARYAGGSNTDREMDFTYSINNNGKERAKTKLPLLNAPLPVEQAQGKITVENKSDGVLFISVIGSGKPLAGEEVPASQNLKMNIRYLDLEGNPIDVSNLVLGTDFKAFVSVTNPGTIGLYKEMALTHIFPSGWEIRNIRLEQGAPQSNANYEYQDIRDDRVLTYFDIGPGSTKTFEILLNATYTGRFYLPGVVCEAMYEENIHANSAGQWVLISRQGSQ